LTASKSHVFALGHKRYDVPNDEAFGIRNEVHIYSAQTGEPERSLNLANEGGVSCAVVSKMRNEILIASETEDTVLAYCLEGPRAD